MFGHFSEKELITAQEMAEKVGLSTTAYYSVDQDWNIAWIKVHQEGEDPKLGSTASTLDQVNYFCENQKKADCFFWKK